MASETRRAGRTGPAKWVAAGLFGLMAATPALGEGTNFRYPHPVGLLQPYSYHGFFPTSWQTYSRVPCPAWADPAMLMPPREMPQQPPGTPPRELLPPPSVGPALPTGGYYRPAAPLVPPYDVAFPEWR